jgi:predicted dehydrogenase
MVDQVYSDKQMKAYCRDYNDFRLLLDDPGIDAVVISTPDNWHAVQSVYAARAGKDIYCEKPLALNVAEGRAIVDAVERFRCVFQTGSHRRSIQRYLFGCELVRNGLIGELHTIRTWVPTGPQTAPQPIMPIPNGFDYDMWLGPAAEKPYTKKRCQGSFRYIFEYGNGMVADLGAHFNDIAQWGNNTDESGPVFIEGKGSFPKDGLFDTAIHINFECTYQNGVKLICKDIWPKSAIGTRFEGSEGWINVGYDKTTTYPSSLMKYKFKPEDIFLYHSKDHLQNFIDCIKSRKKTIAPAEIGQRSATVCHLGNIAIVLGRRLSWDPLKEQFLNDPAANRFLSRPLRYPWII